MPGAKHGGARRIRTDDILLAKQTLYHLSYGPEKNDSLQWLTTNGEPCSDPSLATSYEPFMISQLLRRSIPEIPGKERMDYAP